MVDEMERVKNIPPLQFLKIPTTKGDIKLLIDCGANVNIISKKWALNSLQQIYNIPQQSVKGVSGQNVISEVTHLAIF